jgi:hypothetical protein
LFFRAAVRRARPKAETAAETLGRIAGGLLRGARGDGREHLPEGSGERRARRTVVVFLERPPVDVLHDDRGVQSVRFACAAASARAHATVSACLGPM